ncbi:MAG: DUF4258 domain-containing protein [Candidatus Diapherotrites archaeon]
MPEIVFSKHVKERMLQRGINEATVKDIILNSDYVRTSFGERKIATKRIGRIWHVVFKEERKIVVISVYFD